MEGLLWALFGLLAGLCGLLVPLLLSLGHRIRDKIDQTQNTLTLSSAEMRTFEERLTQVLTELSGERDRTRQRLENLESIVTSQVWEALSPEAGEPERRLLLKDTPERELSDIEKAEELARRVQ